MTNQEQIKDLIARKDALKKFLDIDRTSAWIAEEEKKTEAPDFWNDPKEAQKVVKGINAKKSWVTPQKPRQTDSVSVPSTRNGAPMWPKCLRAKFTNWSA